MFWAPYNSSEMKTINAWFEKPKSVNNQQKVIMKNIVENLKALVKNLIFDRTIVKQIQASRVNKHKLNLYLQQGKISLNEYLFLNK